MGFFLQLRYFRDLMSSQISSRIVEACRSKLQSVVHKIKSSWESSSETCVWMVHGYLLFTYKDVVMLASAEWSP